VAEFVELGGTNVSSDRLAPDVPAPDDPQLTAAIARLQDEPRGERVPPDGWRVLREDDERVIVAAFDPAWPGWTVVSFRRVEGRWEWAGASYGRTPRPTASERGRGFSLRFAARRYDTRVGARLDVSVILTNGSPGTYDGFRPRVIGSLRPVGSNDWLPSSVAFSLVGIPCKLCPGEHLQLAVAFGSVAPDAGVHELRATVGELDLTADGAQLHVGAQ
jgi:hypothetical protein